MSSRLPILPNGRSGARVDCQAVSKSTASNAAERNQAPMSLTTNSATTVARPNRRKWVKRLPFLAVFGPGLVVMLADTDVGSIITAGQSGVQWGYKLLAGASAPDARALYRAGTHRTARGVHRARPWRADPRGVRPGLGLALRRRAGGGDDRRAADGIFRRRRLGDLSASRMQSRCRSAVAALLAVVFTGSYRRVERAAIIIGLFELAFFSSPGRRGRTSPSWRGTPSHMPVRNPNFEYLVAANIGAVIMPWMIFYQQSAIADKKLTSADFKLARWDTAIGAVVTQLVMAVVLIAAAASIRPPRAASEPLHGGADEPGDDALSRAADGRAGVRPRRAGGRHGRRHRRLLALAWGLAKYPATNARWSTTRCRRNGSIACTRPAWSAARLWSASTPT